VAAAMKVAVVTASATLASARRALAAALADTPDEADTPSEARPNG